MNNAVVALQNALKIFEHMPKSLMDIVRKTDPSTVTQHGLYMRPLTDPSLHPLVPKAPPAEAPDTPANKEEHMTSSSAASDSPEATVKGLVKPSEDCAQPAAQETRRAVADAMPSSPVNAPALHAAADEQSSDAADSSASSHEELTGSSAKLQEPPGPAGSLSTTQGSSTGLMGSPSTPMGASTAVQTASASKESLGAPDSGTGSGSDAALDKTVQASADGHVG